MKFGKILSFMIAGLIFINSTYIVFASEERATREYVIHHFIRIVDDPYSFEEGDFLKGFSDYNEISENMKKSLALAVKNKIVGGYEDNTLRPKNNILRIEALALLARALPVNVDFTQKEIKFNDVPQWAANDISKLTKLGLLKGYGNGLMGANDDITKEQVKILVNRLKEFYPVRPQDDYYSYVNQSWIKDTTIERQESRTSLLREAFYKVYDRQVSMLREILQKDTDDRYELDIQLSYEAYLNKEARNKKGLGAIEVYTDIIKAAENLQDLEDRMIRSAKEIGILGLFNLGVTLSLEKEYVYMPYISHYSLGISKEQYQNNDELKTACLNYINKLLSLAKYNPEDAKVFAEKIYNLEEECASLIETQDMYDPDGIKNFITAYDTNKFNFKSFMQRGDMPVYGSVYVYQPKAIKKIFSYYNMENIEFIKAYVVYNTIKYFLNYGPYSILEESQKVDSILNGYESSLTAENRSANMVLSEYEDYFTALYLKKYYDEETKKKVSDLTDDLIKTYKNQISDNQWTSKAYIEKAIKKLDKLKVQISNDLSEEKRKIPADTVSNSRVYKQKKINLIDNRILSLKSHFEELAKVISKEYIVDKNGFLLSPLSTDIRLDEYLNILCIPEGMLVSPLYDKNVLLEDNLGQMGSVIAENLTNSFLFYGTNFDDNHKYGSILTDYDKRKLKELDEKVISLYNTIDMDYSKYFDRDKTKKENLASILSLNCIVELSKNKKLDLKRVFSSYAKTYREKYEEQYLENIFQLRNNLPNKIKVNISLANNEDFINSYHVEETDKLYIDASNRVKVW